MSRDFKRLDIIRKLGSERFHLGNRQLSYDLLGFWQWCSSDLVDNLMRGVLAEYIVALDLGAADTTRVQWDPYDLRTKQGVKIEVKSAAYLQSWAQGRRSKVSFDVRPTYAWDAETNAFDTELKRQAHVYVFAFLKHEDKTTLDPLDLAQWDFYVLRATILDERVPSQNRISLGTLQKLGPLRVGFGGISSAIEAISQDIQGI